jgi:hypothetical protein
MMSGSAKSRDLDRDPRVVLNSVITSPSPPAEIKVRGTARTVTEQDQQDRYAAAVREQIGWQPVVGRFALFIVEVPDVTYIGPEPGTGTQHVARWPPRGRARISGGERLHEAVDLVPRWSDLLA